MSKHPDRYCPVFGNYPKEYNRAVHGPYYSWVNYGPKDTPLQEVKLGELRTWLARRNYTPQAMLASISRSAALYRYKWMDTRYGSPSKALIQIALMSGLASLVLHYGYYRAERHHKYHW